MCCVFSIGCCVHATMWWGDETHGEACNYIRMCAHMHKHLLIYVIASLMWLTWLIDWIDLIDFFDSLFPFDDCFFDLIDLIGLIAWSGLIDLSDSSKVGQILFDWLDVLGWCDCWNLIVWSLAMLKDAKKKFGGRAGAPAARGRPDTRGDRREAPPSGR